MRASFFENPIPRSTATPEALGQITSRLFELLNDYGRDPLAIQREILEKKGFNIPEKARLNAEDFGAGTAEDNTSEDEKVLGKTKQKILDLLNTMFKKDHSLSEYFYPFYICLTDNAEICNIQKANELFALLRRIEFEQKPK